MTAAFVDNFQHRLGKIRPPRVQITYDVEIGDAFEKVQIPFVMGILADLTGDADTRKTLPRLKERKFVEIDRDTFGSVMQKSLPTLRKAVEYTPVGAKEGDAPAKLAVSLTFNGIADFTPSNLAMLVPEMKVLLQKRAVLRDLQSRLDGNDALMDVILEVAGSTDDQKGLLDKITALHPPAEPAVPALPDAKPAEDEKPAE